MNELVIFIVVSLLSFLGLSCGLLAGYFAKEELEPGRLYLNRLYYLTFIAMLATFLVLNQSIIFFMGIPLILIVLSLSQERETLYYYAAFLLLGLAYLYNGFIIIASLVFLLGFPLGSIYLLDHFEEKPNKIAKGLLIRYLACLIIILLFLLGIVTSLV